MPYPCVVGCIKPRCDGLACYTHEAPVAPPAPRTPDGASVPLTEWSTDALASFLAAFEENCPPVVRGPIREAVARLRTIAPLTPSVVRAMFDCYNASDSGRLVRWASFPDARPGFEAVLALVRRPTTTEDR